MNLEKLKKYINNLYPALHTLSIRVRGLLNVAIFEQYKGIIKNNGTKEIDGVVYHYIIVNLNKLKGTSMIKTYSEYSYALAELMTQIGAEDYEIIRADLSFNSDDPEDYELFKKLNRLIICCIASANGITNCYQSSNLWTQKSLSIAIKSDSIEAENYNKFEESQGKYDTKNRLELRSKRITGSLEVEFVTKWSQRLESAVQEFENVQSRYNYHLTNLWNEDKAKKKKDQEYTSMTDFVLRYKDCIFTRRQLSSLFDALGSDNPEKLTKNFKENHSIEFFSLKNVKTITKTLQKKTKNYFDN